MNCLDFAVVSLGELLVVVRGLVLKVPFVPLLTLEPRIRRSVVQRKKSIHFPSVDLASGRLSSLVSKVFQEEQLEEVY